MRGRGFSTIELVVAILILGILLAIGIPLLTRQRARQSLQAQVDTLASDLRLAHSSATAGTPLDWLARLPNLPPPNVNVHDGTVQQQAPILPQPQHLLTGVTSYSVVTADGNGVVGSALRTEPLNPDVTIQIAGDLVGTNLPQLPDPQATSALVLGSDGICFESNGQLSGGGNSQVVVQLANGANSFTVTVSRNGSVSVVQAQ